MYMLSIYFMSHKIKVMIPGPNENMARIATASWAKLSSPWCSAAPFRRSHARRSIRRGLGFWDKPGDFIHFSWHFKANQTFGPLDLGFLFWHFKLGPNFWSIAFEATLWGMVHGGLQLRSRRGISRIRGVAATGRGGGSHAAVGWRRLGDGAETFEDWEVWSRFWPKSRIQPFKVHAHEKLCLFFIDRCSHNQLVGFPMVGLAEAGGFPPLWLSGVGEYQRGWAGLFADPGGGDPKQSDKPKWCGELWQDLSG